MMHEEPSQVSSLLAVNSSSDGGSSPHGGTSQPRQSLRRLVAGERVEVHDLLSRRRELADLLAEAQRENELLRAQTERSAAALDSGQDTSDVSKALRKHANCVRRLHEEMRAVKIRERSTERKLKKKEAKLDKVSQEVKKTKELLDKGDDLPQEDELYNRMARAANTLTAKDSLIQELRDQIARLTASHAAALDQQRLLQKDKKRETQRLYAHTDQLQSQIKLLDRELAKGLIYTQKAMRHAQGRVNLWTNNDVDSVSASSSAQSAPEHRSTALTFQQKIKQFDASRRERWHEQMQRELARKRLAEARRRRHEDEAERLRQLEAERALAEHQERERMRQEAEQMEEIEREKSQRADEQRRRLAEAMQRTREERERRLQEDVDRLGREDDERRKKRCREMIERDTEAALRSRGRWYYEGSGGTDWRPNQPSEVDLPLVDAADDADRTACRSQRGKVPPIHPADDTDTVSHCELVQYNKLPPLRNAECHSEYSTAPALKPVADGAAGSTASSCSLLPEERSSSARRQTASSNSVQPQPAAATKLGRLARRRQNCPPTKKSPSNTKAGASAASEPGTESADCFCAEISLDTGVPDAMTTADATENQ